MKTLFDPVRIGSLSLKNRLIRSATNEKAADANGRFSATLAPIYEALARGGIGAVISGQTGVGANSRQTPQMVDAGNDDAIPEFRALMDIFRAHDCKFIVQLSHCGERVAFTENGGPALGPSDGEQPSGRKIRAMTGDDIAAVVGEFARAAARCKEAGVDGVQLHGAHGYGLHQFLSPHCNKRTDAYGGGIENRGRLILEIYEAVREAVGPGYPVWIKLSGRDFVDDATTWDDFLWFCRELDKRGIDSIELSGGIGRSGESVSSPSWPLVKSGKNEAPFAPDALELAATVKAPVISVCGYRSPETINEWLNKGNIAAVSLCRPLLAEPGLAKRWSDGDLAPARCISCNKCFTPDKGFGCQVL